MDDKDLEIKNCTFENSGSGYTVKQSASMDLNFKSVFSEPTWTALDVWAQYDDAGAMIGLVHVPHGSVETAENDDGFKYNKTPLPNGHPALRAQLVGVYRAR